MKNLEIRTIEHKGIKISYKIDFDKREISLVEKNNQNWQAQQFVFKEGGLEYITGWNNLLEAIQEVLAIAKKELDEEIEIDREEQRVKSIECKLRGGGSNNVSGGAGGVGAGAG